MKRWQQETSCAWITIGIIYFHINCLVKITGFIIAISRTHAPSPRWWWWWWEGIASFVTQGLRGSEICGDNTHTPHCGGEHYFCQGKSPATETSLMWSFENTQKVCHLCMYLKKKKKKQIEPAALRMRDHISLFLLSRYLRPVIAPTLLHNHATRVGGILYSGCTVIWAYDAVSERLITCWMIMLSNGEVTMRYHLCHEDPPRVYTHF